MNFDFPNYSAKGLQYFFLLFSDEGEIETIIRKMYHSVLVDFERKNAALISTSYLNRSLGKTAEPINFHQFMPTMLDESDPGDILRKITAELSLARNGRVRGIKVLSDCSEEQKRAAKEALYHWKFFPKLEAGEPVESTVQVEVAFNLP